MDEKKVCGICKVQKLLTEFAFRDKKKGTLQNRCKSCKKSYNKEHYVRNTPVYKQRGRSSSLKFKEKMRTVVNELKRAPCKDCGITYPPYVMDFDHIDRKNKNFSISRAILLQKPMDEVLAEINKCELVCSNCHRIRTHERKQNVPT